MKTKAEIKVTYGKEIEIVMEKLGILNKVKSGKLTCQFCKKQVSPDEVFTIFVDSGKIKIASNHQACIDKFYEYLEKKKYGN